MECKDVLACRAVKRLFPSFLLFFALAIAFTVPAGAQTTATVTPINYGAAVGILQAGDGDFYALSRFGLTCDTDSSQYCSYIYKLASDGTVSVFHTFPPVPTSTGNNGVNTEGYLPVALIYGTDGNFYGTCQAGGPGGSGTIFQVTPAGVLTVLKSFGVTANNADPGSQPNSLIQGADGNFYFTNSNGVYQLTPEGGFSTVFTFAGTTQGNNATSIMQASDGNFYLTLGGAPTAAGVTSTNYGAIVEITPGGQWSLIHSFAPDGSEGTSPGGPLVEGSDGELYGVSQVVINTVRTGVAYKVSLGGVINLLHSFTGPIFNNWDTNLIVGSDGNIYGTTLQGGDTASENCTPLGCGSLYQLTTSGKFTDLHDFEGGKVDPTNPPVPPTIDGAGPTSLVQTDGYFYGTQVGGQNTAPVVYKASLTSAIQSPIQLTFDPATDVKPGDTVTLTWSVLNAFSLTAQQCGASIIDNPISAGTWTGPQKGSLSGGVYGGSAKITPTANGVYTYALTCGGKESGFARLVVNDAGPLQIVTQSLNPATVSQSPPYNALMMAIGGFPPYTWTVDGTLPPGLTFDGDSGTLSGTPEQFGKYPVVFSVKDTSQPPLDPLPSQAITITVKSGLTLVQNLFNPILGVAYSGYLAPDTSGGLPPYTWNLTAGPLPPGLQLDSTTGLISGTPTALGQFSFTITVSDSESTPDKVPVTFNLKVAGPLQVTTPSPLQPAAAVGVPYSSTLAASGGTPPYSWSFGNNTAGSVPPGLSLTTDGTLAGTPTQYTPPSANYNTFNVVVSDSSNPKLTTPATLSILVARTLKIETAALPTATVGVTTDVPLTASGGVPPYTWTATVLPNPNIGVQIVNGNTLEYNPIAATNSIVTLTVTDSENIADSTQVNLPLTIMPLQLATTTALTSSNSTAGTSQSVVLTAMVTQPQGGVAPTGQVTFFNGTAILGTAMLGADATATFQTSFASIGVYSITASYGGNAIYAASASAPLTETVVTPTINGSISPSSVTIQSGKTGQLVITITPVGDYTGTINFSCGTLPPHVSCAFNPASLTIPANSGPLTDTLTVTTGGTQVASTIEPFSGRGPTPAGIFSAVTFWLPGSLGLLLTLVSRKWRLANPRRLNDCLVATLWILCAMGLASCGATNANKVAPGTYQIPVTLSVQGQAMQSINVTVIVQ